MALNEPCGYIGNSPDINYITYSYERGILNTAVFSPSNNRVMRNRCLWLQGVGEVYANGKEK